MDRPLDASDISAAQDMETPNNSCCAVSVKLPIFTPNNASTWFRRAEVQFRLKRISSQTTMADYVLHSLSEDVIDRLSPWLDDQPDRIQYSCLKSYILKAFSPSNSERLLRLIDLIRRPFSNEETVQQLWHQITNLSNLPGVDGKQHLLDFRREFLILCLPEHVRQGIAHDNDLPVTQLIEKAESLRLCGLTSAAKSSRGIVAGNVASVARSESQSTSLKDELISKVDNRSKNFRRFKQNRGYLMDSGLCNYHARWGEKARFCVEGCCWKPSKNGLFGRR